MNSSQCKYFVKGKSCAVCEHFMECDSAEHFLFEDVLRVLRANDIPRMKKVIGLYGIEEDRYSCSPELFGHFISPLMANLSEDLLAGTGATEDTAKQVFRMLSPTLDLYTWVDFLPTTLEGDQLKSYLDADTGVKKVRKLYKKISRDYDASFDNEVAALSESEFFGLIKAIKHEKPERVQCRFGAAIVDYCFTHELVKLPSMFYMLALSAHDHYLKLKLGRLRSGFVIGIR